MNERNVPPTATFLVAPYSLKTRPVSWTSPVNEAPEILDSRIEETSEAAVG